MNMHLNLNRLACKTFILLFLTSPIITFSAQSTRSFTQKQKIIRKEKVNTRTLRKLLNEISSHSGIGGTGNFDCEPILENSPYLSEKSLSNSRNFNNTLRALIALRIIQEKNMWAEESFIKPKYFGSGVEDKNWVIEFLNLLRRGKDENDKPLNYFNVVAKKVEGETIKKLLENLASQGLGQVFNPEDVLTYHSIPLNSSNEESDEASCVEIEISESEESEL